MRSHSFFKKHLREIAKDSELINKWKGGSDLAVCENRVNGKAMRKSYFSHTGKLDMIHYVTVTFVQFPL